MAEVIVSRADGIVEIRLDRAAKKNALTAAMYRALTEALAAADADDEARTVLLTASGETFCAGNDIAGFLEPPPDLEHWPPQRFISALVEFSKPLVAVIGVPHPKWGEAVKALVVPRPGQAPNPEELIAMVGRFQAPKIVEFIDSIPQTAVGKPDKKALRARFGQRAD